MSFQKAHNISNELAEVVITSVPVATTGWSTTAILFDRVPTVAGNSFRVLETGFTVTIAGTNTADAAAFSVGISGDADAFILDAGVPATPAIGLNISTSKGGADTLSFVAAGDGNVDADGVPSLNAGNVAMVTPSGNITDGPTVVFYMRLAPVINRDVG